jgi:hypothetical protein
VPELVPDCGCILLEVKVDCLRVVGGAIGGGDRSALATMKAAIGVKERRRRGVIRRSEMLR